MSNKERNKRRRYAEPFQTQAERRWRAVTPFFYKKLQTRERLFHGLFSQGAKAQRLADRCCHIKGVQYEDAEEIAITLVTPGLE
jgi:hypothetical protein